MTDFRSHQLYTVWSFYFHDKTTLFYSFNLMHSGTLIQEVANYQKTRNHSPCGISERYRKWVRSHFRWGLKQIYIYIYIYTQITITIGCSADLIILAKLLGPVPKRNEACVVRDCVNLLKQGFFSFQKSATNLTFSDYSNANKGPLNWTIILYVWILCLLSLLHFTFEAQLFVFIPLRCHQPCGSVRVYCLYDVTIIVQ